MAILILLIILGLIGLSSWFISNQVYKGLRKGNNEYALAWGIIVFVATFAAITIGIYYLIIYNIRIER